MESCLLFGTKFLPSSFLSNIVKIKIYRSIIVNGVLFGRKNLVSLMEEGM